MKKDYRLHNPSSQVLDQPGVPRSANVPAILLGLVLPWLRLYFVVLTTLFFWVVFFLTSTALFAQLPPDGFSTATVGTGWNQPVGLTFSPDGIHTFVWEKGGKVWTVAGGTKGSAPLIDISEEVGNWRDHGLVSFAVDPRFETNGYVYLFYAVDRHHLLKFGTAAYNTATNEYLKATISRITRYTVSFGGNALTVDRGTRKVLLGETRQTGIPILHESHGAGSLVFGTDGTLLVTTGDGASYAGLDMGKGVVGVDNYSANDSIIYGRTYAEQALVDGIIKPEENTGVYRAQMPSSLNGKVLRLDPETGNGIPGNPYYNPADPRSARSRVWALGLRNSYRMTKRPDTGSHVPADRNPGVFYFGDVGWGTVEELNVLDAPGLNFGWPIFEGLEWNTAYPYRLTRNRLAPNPLYNGSGCTIQYFSYRDLIKQPVLGRQPSFPNPCNASAQIPSQYTFVHQRPVLDWKHGDSTTARVGIFNGTAPGSTVGVIKVGAAGSPVSGAQFGGNCSTGGVWYVGNDFPAQYKNTYFHADYGTGWVRNLTVDGGNRLSRVNAFIDAGTSVVGMATNPVSGGLYYIQLGGSPFAQEVRQITYSGNRPPRAVALANQTYGPGPLTVEFTGNTSADPEGLALRYAWNFGDGSPVSNAPNPAHQFTAASGGPARYDVTLTVTDAQGITSVATLIISVNNTPPTARITSPVNNARYSINQPTVYNLTASVTDAEQSGTGLSYRWQTILHHNNHEHPDPYDTNRATSAEISPIGCDGETYYFRILLTVTDAAGLSGSDEVRVYPNCQSGSPDVANVAATAATGRVTINWTNPSPEVDEVMIVAKAGSGVGAVPTGDGSTYTADLNFGGAGSPFDGGKVVYKGKASPQVVTNLTNIPYFFTVFTRTSSTWSEGVGVSATPTGKSTPVLTWPTPASIAYGTALGTAQLNATANVAGTFTYTPAAGTVLNAGNAQALSVQFTPADQASYNTANALVYLNVNASAGS
ncbi:MAG: PQQ-dependent sugar dehydrogenase, partial [Ferruginibacter sp.]|nr:PQQ-dependent sugar dehydrogenase [Cytophagales bacterium]